MAALLAIGECMMELTPHGNNTYNRSFAGDTYNALVYAKRNSPELNALVFSAVGDDEISRVMKSQWRKECVSDAFTLTSNNATIGIYAISTDEKGERSFSYWRKNSAATQMMSIKPVDELIESCPELDCVFFSGISLAILSEVDKEKLIAFVAGLRTIGVKVAFDPNYRPAMWQDNNHAIKWLEKAYAVSDIILPGEEDHQALFGHGNHTQIAEYCLRFGIQEIVIKCGEQGTYVVEENKVVAHQPFKAAAIQVDSTAAGDSFAGTYLAQRIAGESMLASLQKASLVAGHVVQHSGAIMPTELYDSVINGGEGH